METSALDGTNIDQAFDNILECISIKTLIAKLESFHLMSKRISSE